MMFKHWCAWQEGREIYVMKKWVVNLKKWVEIKSEAPFKVVIELTLGFLCIFSLLTILGIIILAY